MYSGLFQCGINLPQYIHFLQQFPENYPSNTLSEQNSQSFTFFEVFKAHMETIASTSYYFVVSKMNCPYKMSKITWPKQNKTRKTVVGIRFCSTCPNHYVHILIIVLWSLHKISIKIMCKQSRKRCKYLKSKTELFSGNCQMFSVFDSSHQAYTLTLSFIANI